MTILAIKRKKKTTQNNKNESKKLYKEQDTKANN